MYIVLWTFFRDCRESTVVTKVFLVEYKQPNIFSIEDNDKNFLKDVTTQASFNNCNPLSEFKELYVWDYLKIKSW